VNLLIAAADLYIPTSVRRKKLLQLYACTASAFDSVMPEVRGLPYAELLRSYAAFTAAQANRAPYGESPVIRSDPISATKSSRQANEESPRADLPEIRRRLHDGAYRIGSDLRHSLHVQTASEALAAARLLYRAIGIELATTATGEITVQRCFFSDFYSAPVCRLIASLDQGLFAGLSAGGRLTFTERITEGRPCCRAILALESEEDIDP